MTPKFKVGDKVRVLDGSEIKNYRGSWVYGMKPFIGKEFKVEKVEGTSCAFGVGYRLSNVMYIFDERGLELVKEEKTPNESIVIYRKGNEVIALDKVTGDKAVAKCSPEDEFDFMIGATLAYSRLPRYEITHEKVCGKEKTEKFYNGKVVCIDNCRNKGMYTVGKVYKFKNGVLIADDGFPMQKFRSFEEFANFTASKFIELVDGE